jgi:DNA-binding XRE family transcriptional regulator
MNKKITTLKHARDVLGLTQDQLGKEWGISSINISRWERGVCKPLGIFQEKIDELIKRAELKQIVDGCTGGV